MKNNPLNRYLINMAEVNFSRNPLASDVILVLNDVKRDIYQDAVTFENNRIKKRAMVTKDAKLSYVQFLPDAELTDENDTLPWKVTMTLWDIHEKDEYGVLREEFRVPRTDDQVLIDGVLYTISFVEPVNRQLDGVINCTIYPEHSSPDRLDIYSVKVLPSGFLDIIWCGDPILFAYGDQNTDPYSDQVYWRPFKSFLPPVNKCEIHYPDPDQVDTVFVKNKAGDIANYKFR